MVGKPGEAVKCRSCGAPIVWARTNSGKAMPVDAEPVANGNLYLYRNRGDGTIRVTVSEEGGTRKRFRPHFATCPEAQAWRR